MSKARIEITVTGDTPAGNCRAAALIRQLFEARGHRDVPHGKGPFVVIMEHGERLEGEEWEAPERA